MTLSLNITPLIPYLVLSWVGAAIISVAGLAIAERKGRLPDRPILCTALQFIDIGSFFTVGILASEAHNQGLIPLWLFIVLPFLTKAIFFLVWKVSSCADYDAV